MSFPLTFSSWYLLDDVVARLHITGWRLGVGGGNLHLLFNPHVTPRLRQTARCRLASCLSLQFCRAAKLSVEQVKVRRTCCRFHYIVGLYFIVGTVLNFTTLSACNTLSIQYSITLLRWFVLFYGSRCFFDNALDACR